MKANTKAEVMDRLRGFDVNIYVQGTWVWVSGSNANGLRRELRDIGFRFSPKKHKWYWRQPEQNNWKPSKLKINNDDWANPNHRR